MHTTNRSVAHRTATIVIGVAMTVASLIAMGAAPAQAATTCGYTSYKNSTFAYAGISLWRHEARGTVCENNVNIVDVRPYINQIVKIGVGNVYNKAAWDDRGYVPATTSWNRLSGRSGMYISLPFVGEIGVCRTRQVTFNWSMSGSQAVYTTSNTGWMHTC